MIINITAGSGFAPIIFGLSKRRTDSEDISLPVATNPAKRAGHAILLHLKYVIACTATSGLARKIRVMTNGLENQMQNASTVPIIKATHKPSAVKLEAFKMQVKVSIEISHAVLCELP